MNKNLLALLIISISIQSYGQSEPLAPGKKIEPSAMASTSSTPIASSSDDEGEKPNGRRIRRQLNLILGVEHDEELLIPERDISIKGSGSSENFEIKRIRGTDYFRIMPKRPSSGIATINDKKTGQILVELRYDIRDGIIEKKMREIQSLLADIEGLEFKMANDKILLDGYVLLPRDLIRIGNVAKKYDGQVTVLATLSPLSRKKIAEYIAKDVNNPEVSISAAGNFIKMEGRVNNENERKRIKDIIGLYMPDLVVDKVSDLDHLTITGRKNGGNTDEFIIDLTTLTPAEEKTEPPPKMIQVVVHFVQFIESYGKNFKFVFAPSFQAATSSAGTLNDTFNLIDRLAPKLQWAKAHGYARVLDTASIVTQEKKLGKYTNVINIASPFIPSAIPGGAPTPSPAITATVEINVTPAIKSERSGLIELPLHVSVSDVDGLKTTSNTVDTTLSVRDRQSAAFAGIIKKKATNEFGGDPGVSGAIVTFQSKKKYDKSSSNFVVFVTPIIKSSASAGVDQVKKKFRLRE